MTRINARVSSQMLRRLQWGAALSAVGALGIAAALSAADSASRAPDSNRFPAASATAPTAAPASGATFMGRIGPSKSAAEAPKPAPAQAMRMPAIEVEPFAAPPTLPLPQERTEAARPRFTDKPPAATQLPGNVPPPVETIEERMSQRATQFTPRPSYQQFPEQRPAPDRQAQIEVVNYQQPPKNPDLAADGNFEVIEQKGQLEVNVGRSLLLRTRTDIYRTAVVDPRTVEVVQFTPREVSIIGKGTGATHVTFWFRDGDGMPVTYLVKVAPDAVARQRMEAEYHLLEDLIGKLFPDSKVYLMQVADKLIVRGQAKDIEEAAQIMTVIRGNAGRGGGRGGGMGGGFRTLSDGVAAHVLTPEETGRQNRPRIQLINLLRVPGVQQVALRVKIAELNRTAARGIGVDVNAQINFGDSASGSGLFLQSLLGTATGGAPSLLAKFDGDDIQIGVNYLQQHGVVRLLSEPTVVTMSGQSATFVAGGEFAVPTVVGTAGLNAVTTDFRSFGAIISFMPTVVDKDRIRLSVSPEFSQINKSLSVGNTPGLNVRAVTTTVEMREGQTLAIAGLLEDTMSGSTTGTVPGLSWIFGNRSMTRAETELIILVTPELVHPMEADEVPPLPGFDVTEPTNGQFYLHSRLEGDPTMEYRSTVWPHLRYRYKAGGSAMISGPFGHGK
jgi:pilus assembly protein CpaC